MANKTVIHHPLWGDIEIIKSVRARQISLSIKPFHPIKVTIPYGLSIERAQQFLLSKQDWIEKSRKKIQHAEESQLVFSAETVFKTRDRVLQIRHEEGLSHPLYHVSVDTILFKFPPNIVISSPAIQKAIKKVIVEVLRKEAKTYLPSRVAELAKTYGFVYQQVSVKNAKSLWGSCSYQNNINLNVQLMLLPDELIDYVIIHELTHTIHKDHSPRFWAHMATILPDVMSLRKKIKQHRLHLHA